MFGSRIWGFVAALLVFSALRATVLSAQTSLNCQVDENFVALGCSGGRDCIPALTNPKILQASEAHYLPGNELVLGVYRNGVARAYPHRLLWWHEVVNDTVGAEMVTTTLCPLTGTGMLFDASLNGEEHTFGVSGLLYNSNLIMYDRLSGQTLFPQMCPSGQVSQGSKFEATGDALTLLPIVEATWAAWKTLYPETTVLDDDTGTEFNYSHYPYGDYRTNDAFLLYSVAKEDPRLPRKDMILGLNLDGIQRAYPFNAMGERTVLNDKIGGNKVVVLFSEEAKLALAFYRNVAGLDLTFELSPEIVTQGIFHVRDRETGTVWDMKGQALSGPLATIGLWLQQIPAYNAMWFAWAAFWNQTEIADIESLVTTVEPVDSRLPARPSNFVLHQNFPNPFNPTTTIVYNLTRSSAVTLTVYDVSGREVRTLLRSVVQSRGENRVTWDGRDNSGVAVGSSVYVSELDVDGERRSRKMVLLR